MRFGLLAILGGGLVSAAAQAAEVNCVIERTSAPLKSEVLVIAGKVAADPDGTPGGEQSITDKLAGPLKTCTATYRWSAAKSEAAMNYAISSLLTEALRRDLTQRGVSLAAIDTLVAANPTVFNPPLGTENATEPQVNKVVAEAKAAGIPVDESELGQLVLTYFGAIAVTHLIEREFESV